MEKSSKRGKIPQSDWPLIMARYEAGETLASIARTYDCSPPAISYVVSRSRARLPEADSAAKPPGAAEPQLIKGAASEVAATGSGRLQGSGTAGGTSAGNGPIQLGAATHAAPLSGSAASPGERRDSNPGREGNGFAHNGAAEPGAHSSGTVPHPVAPPQRPSTTPPPQANGSDQRRTLHLSLGGTAAGNGSAPPADPPSSSHADLPERGQSLQSNPPPSYRGRDAAASPDISNIRPAFNEPVGRNDAAPRKDGGGAFIDKELRARVDGDIAAFLEAFDAALLADTRESRSALREATDRLLRAGARTRIELERLEARIPLPARDNGGNGEPAWRYR
jgi:hypothetical protein